MWNQRYDRPDYLFGTEPAVFLTRAAGVLPDGSSVLCVADGEGRNSVWLAGLGHEVTAFDYSDIAVSKARALAKARDVSVDFREGNILSWNWAERHYDAVVAVFIQFLSPDLRDEVFASMTAAIRPGGLLLLHGYAPRQVEYGTGGPGIAENMYTLDMLRSAFADFEVLEARDYDAEIAEGEGHSGKSGLIDFVARKPLPT